MITANEARCGTKTENNKEYKEFMEEIEKRIRCAMNDGRRSCCFGNWDAGMNSWEVMAKEEFTKRGFMFRPTGIVGGVYQHTQDICW